MKTLKLIPKNEIDRVEQSSLDDQSKLPLLADLHRANTLMAVKRAGSGHLGSSLSAMDIVVHLYYREMNTRSVGFDSADRDIYFSSKGHDVPGLYAVLYGLGVIPEERFLNLRRYRGLDGHPDVGIPGIEANSGSLGMGISKGRGMAWAKRYRQLGGRVYVMTGDGELQEGQNYEGLRATVDQGVHDLTVIVDHNKVQSDKRVDQIGDLGHLEEKLASFGWHVQRASGHDFAAFGQSLAAAKQEVGRPSIIIADTIKGSGVSFMEHPEALKVGQGLYPWHAGAPDDESYMRAHDEILQRINEQLVKGGLGEVAVKDIEPHGKKTASALASQNALGEPVSEAARAKLTHRVSDEYVAKAYGDALLSLAKERENIVVLDADLAADCRIRDFEDTYPDRFIQNGIAEQDMVSMAGGLARHGLLPIVNSFASFLMSRANEQIYNNATEGSKIVYAAHYAGLIPAGPGKSHQSVRDITLCKALPNIVHVQPCNAAETDLLLRYCVNACETSSVIRLIIGPSPRLVELPDDYEVTEGRGALLHDGSDAVMFAYGPVMLHEALLAAEMLKEEAVGLRVVHMPFLNRFDVDWLATTIGNRSRVFVLEDHACSGGLAEGLLRTMTEAGATVWSEFKTLGVEGYPACGTPHEALVHHALDSASLAAEVKSAL